MREDNQILTRNVLNKTSTHDIYLTFHIAVGWALWRAPVIQLLWKPGLADRLRVGVLFVVVLWRSGAHAKLGIDMVVRSEGWTTRSSKEGRTGPGRKRSRQKSPCGAVAG